MGRGRSAFGARHYNLHLAPVGSIDLCSGKTRHLSHVAGSDLSV